MFERIRHWFSNRFGGGELITRWTHPRGKVFDAAGREVYPCQEANVKTGRCEVLNMKDGEIVEGFHVEYFTPPMRLEPFND